MKRAIWVVVIGIVVLGTVYAMLPQTIAVPIGTPEIQTVEAFISEEAKTRLNDTYTLAMPVNGTLERITLEVGDEVRAGDVVARLDDHDLVQQVRELDAHIAQVRAQMEGVDVSKPKPIDMTSAGVQVQEARDNARMAEKAQTVAELNRDAAARDFARAEELLAKGVLSPSQRDDAARAYDTLKEDAARQALAVDAARKALRLAELSSTRLEESVDDNEYMRTMYQAEIESLDAQRAVAQRDLEKTALIAPVSGPIISKFVMNRQVLPAGTPLLEIGDLSTMEIESDVLSEEVVRVTPGDKVEIMGKALTNESKIGEVSRIYPAAFEKISALGIEQQRVKVIIAFDNTEVNLRPGTRLDVRIITDAAEDVVALPERAIFRRAGAWYVFVAEKGKARLQEVTVGLKNDTWVEVRDGIGLDTRVVLEPTNELDVGARLAAK